MPESDSVLFNVDIENYNGPLDVLLDLAKTQKVDLEELSITKLADQFHDYITNAKDLNLEIASEYLLMATWLAYHKSKLLLPGTPEEEFKVQEVADKLKEEDEEGYFDKGVRVLIVNMNSQPEFEGTGAVIQQYDEKSYSTIIMTKDFQRINIPKLPVFTTEDGIKTIKEFFGNLIDWKNLDDLIPKNFKTQAKYRKTGKSGIFAGSLELVKEGSLKIKQDNLYENVYVKEVND